MLEVFVRARESSRDPAVARDPGRGLDNTPAGSVGLATPWMAAKGTVPCTTGRSNVKQYSTTLGYDPGQWKLLPGGVCCGCWEGVAIMTHLPVLSVPSCVVILALLWLGMHQCARPGGAETGPARKFD